MRWSRICCRIPFLVTSAVVSWRRPKATLSSSRSCCPCSLIKGTWLAEMGSGGPVGEIDRIELPPTIRALLATRLDQLESDERRVVDPAAVIGKVFQGRAVADLVDEQMRRLVGGLLKVLIGRGLMREDSIGPDGDLYSFRHLLIQDAAYDAMSKRRRSELHESYARWLQEAAGDRANEYEEIVGYHLEQAYHLRMQLGALRDSGQLLGEAAAGWLSRAARRTAALGATAAAARLLRRAAILLPDPGFARMHVMLELGEALLETGDLVEAGEVIAEADRLARANEDANAQAQARVLSLLRQFQFDAEAASVLTRQAAPQLLRTFTDSGDELGLARTWRLLAHIDVLNCRFGQAREGFQRAADHAQAGRNQREEYDNLAWLVIASVWGSAPADAGLQTCWDVLARAGSDLTLQITALLGSAVLKAMLGSTTEARDLSRQAKALIEDLGPSMFTEVAKGQTCAYVEMYSGAAAESEALESYRFLDGTAIESGFPHWPQCWRRPPTPRSGGLMPSATWRLRQRLRLPAISMHRFAGAELAPGCWRGPVGWPRLTGSPVRHFTLLK